MKEKFIPITTIEVEKSAIFSDIKNKSQLLIQYKNNNTFFDEKLYKFYFNNELLIIFGYDFGGCFVFNCDNYSIGYLYGEDGLFCLKFCNSGINDFISFHNSFICVVFKRINHENNKLTEEIAILEKYFREVDSISMSDDSFWPMRLYELSEGFFPLNDSRLKLYASLD